MVRLKNELIVEEGGDMEKVIRMPSIEQFRSVVHHINKAVRFQRLDDNGEPIYNNDPLPTLGATGTVKLHGTNASVCYNEANGMWAQSKKNVISIEKDNAGFAFFFNRNLNIFEELFSVIRSTYGVDNENETSTIYGEWAGKGVQGNVGISALDKHLYIFGVKISPHDEEKPAYWVDSNIFQLDTAENIYHVSDFTEFKLTIDFNNPLLSNNKMVEMVQEVEEECPVAKHFGVSGIGEGIVFEVNYKNVSYKWKMKGEKHAGKSKVKKAEKVDDVKLQLIIDTVEKVTPEWRLSQMYQETFGTINGGKGSIKKTGDYLRAVIKDIMKEEVDAIGNAGLTPKDVNATISKKARTWFMTKLDEEAGMG